MSNLMSQWDDQIQRIATEEGVDPKLFRALVHRESAGNAKAVSPVGAYGLTQLMPATARELGVDRYDPMQNLRGGARYLKQQLDAFGGDVVKGVAAYNAGPGSEKRGTGVRGALKRGGLHKLPNETKDYVKAITGYDVMAGQQGSPKPVSRSLDAPQYFSNEQIVDKGKQLEELRAQQEAANQRQDSWSTLMETSMKEDFIIPSIMSYHDRLQLHDDPDWTRPSTETLVNDLQSAGLGHDYLPRLMEAHSQAQYDAMLKQASEETQRNQLLAQNGWRGSVARIGMNIVDPVSLGVAVATGGAGIGIKLGRAGYIATQGALNAGINGVMEGAMVGMKETRSTDDVLYSMAGSFILGGGFSAAAYKSILGDELANEIINKQTLATHTLRNDVKLIQEIELARKAGDAQRVSALAEQLTPDTQQAFMNGTAGAAQTGRIEQAIFDTKGVQKSIEDHIDEIESNIFQNVLDENAQRTAIGKGIDWFVGKARWDASGYLLERDSPWAKLLGRIGENGTGVDSTGRSTGFSAEEVAKRLRHTQEAKWLRETTEAFEESDRAAGFGFRGNHVRRKAFFNNVIDVVEGLAETTDPHVAKAAAATKQFFRKYKTEGQAAGILEDVADRGDNYIPHIMDYGKIRQLADEYKPDEISKVVYESMKKAYLPKMKEVLDELDVKIKDLEAKVKSTQGKTPDQIKASSEITEELEKLKAYRKKYPELLDKLQQATAKGYTNNVLRRGIVGQNKHSFSAIRLDDAADLRAKLSTSGLSEEEINEIIEGMSIHNPKKGSVSRAKPRVEFDMSHAVVLASKHTGEKKLVSMKDFFSRDLDYIIPMYGRQMSGRIGIAQVTGIKNDSEFETILENMRIDAGPKEVQTQAFKRAENYARFLYNAVVGNPLDADPASWMSKWGRRLRDYNFVVRGGAFVAAQIAEIGNTLGAIGIKAAFKQMPVLADIRTAFTGKKPTNEFMRQLEAMTAVSSNRIRNQIFTSMDEAGLPLEGSVDRFLHNAKNAIADYSGFNMVMAMESRMAAAGMAQRLVDISRKVKGDITKLEPAQLRELKSLGFRTDEDLQKVFSHLADDSKTKVTKSWGRVYEFNEDAWDAEAFNTMTLALQRAANRLVQENSYGSSIPLMHGTIGKILFQFRSFAMNAVTKQTLQALSQRDAAVAMRVIYGLVFGSLSYMGQTIATKSGTDGYEEAMKPEKIALAAVSRMGLSSMIPAAFDAGVGLVSRGTVNGLWSHARSSGLGTGLLDSNPTVKGLISAQTVLAGTPQAVFNDDYQFSKDDLAAWADLTPGAGLAPFKLAINTMMDDLPRKSFKKAIDLEDYFK